MGIGTVWHPLISTLWAHLADRVGAIVQILEGVVAVRVSVGHTAVAQPNLPAFQGGVIRIQPVAVDVQELVTIQPGWRQRTIPEIQVFDLGVAAVECDRVDCVTTRVWIVGCWRGLDQPSSCGHTSLTV